MKLRSLMVCLLALLLAATIFGQTSQPQPAPSGNGPGQPGEAPRADHHDRHMFMPPGMPMGMPPMGGPSMMGKWWKNAEVVQKLQLSDDQLQRLEKIFQDSRLHLIDLHAALEKEEAQLEPLVDLPSKNIRTVCAGLSKTQCAMIFKIECSLR